MLLTSREKLTALETHRLGIMSLSLRIMMCQSFKR